MAIYPILSPSGRPSFILLSNLFDLILLPYYPLLEFIAQFHQFMFWINFMNLCYLLISSIYVLNQFMFWINLCSNENLPHSIQLQRKNHQISKYWSFFIYSMCCCRVSVSDPSLWPRLVWMHLFLITQWVLWVVLSTPYRRQRYLF